MSTFVADHVLATNIVPDTMTGRHSWDNIMSTWQGNVKRNWKYLLQNRIRLLCS